MHFEISASENRDADSSRTHQREDYEGALAPSVPKRQEQAEADVKRTWAQDSVGLLEGRVRYRYTKSVRL